MSHVRSIVDGGSAVVPGHDPGLLGHKFYLRETMRRRDQLVSTAKQKLQRTLVLVSELKTLSLGSSVVRVGKIHES